MMFTGCKKDSEVVRLKAQIERVGGDSKVWLNENDAPQFFQSGEYVKINDNDPLEIQYSNGVFTLTPDAADDYYAVYPASIVTDEAITSNTVGIKLPHLQNYAYVVDADDNQIQKINLPSGAVSSGSTLRFYNLCSLIEVQCTIPTNATGTYTISSIEVTAKDKGLWGEGTATLDGTSSSINIPYNGHNSRVVLEIPNATAISAGQSTGKYYIVVPPYDGTADFTVKVRFNQGSSSFTATKTGAVLERNIIVELNRTQAPTEDNEVSGYFTIKRPNSNGTGGMKVVFSKGNVQKDNGAWKFADHQYDYFGSKNIASSAGYNYFNLSNTVDLFSWPINGRNYGSENFQDDLDHYFESYNQVVFNDWGNLFSGDWFTLSKDEWTVLTSRTSTDQQDLQAKVIITGVTGHPSVSSGSVDVKGLVLLPDDWTAEDVPSGLEDYFHTGPNYVNTLTVAQWARLEAAGAVFLPAAGFRMVEGGYYQEFETGGEQYEEGHYWSCSLASSDPDYGGEAYYVRFKNTTLAFPIKGGNNDDDDCCPYGKSVRLVKPAPGYTINNR